MNRMSNFLCARVIIIIEYHDIDGLVQDYSNSIASAMELLQSSTKPPNYVVQSFVTSSAECKQSKCDRLSMCEDFFFFNHHL